MRKYVKKPVIIEVVQFTGANYDELVDFAGNDIYQQDGFIFIKTIEGDMKMKNKVGDFLIKGIKGEFYFCEKSVFEQTYSPVETFNERDMF